MKRYRLWYDKEAPCGNEALKSIRDMENRDDDGWERWSLPIGNGYMGVNVFGRTMTERLQITENSLFNPQHLGGLNNFCELYLDFGHDTVQNYTRELDLERAVATTAYDFEGARYERTHFASYPDRVFVTHLTASVPGRLTFAVRPIAPYACLYMRRAGDGAGKSGTVRSEGDRLILEGEMHYYGIQFEGQFKVLHRGGRLTNRAGMLILEGADEATLLVAIGTNYRLESRVFTEPEPRKKLAPYPHPHREVTRRLNAACEREYEALLARHLADYQELFSRVRLDLGGEEPDFPTDLLLNEYCQGDIARYPLREYFRNKAGDCDRYLEALYFQYGRYLLISCSRPGSLPATLQGVWNRYQDAPFSCGYWHNINVQMNYWPAFSANLAETFEAYAAYFQAYQEAARQNADEYIRDNYPANYQAGETGWCIGTPAFPYSVPTVEINRNKAFHSGPATGALTAKLFWDYYDFTRNERVLREIAYPAVSGMAAFLSRTLEAHGGKMLVTYSASPEQYETCAYERYHPTAGCAFDQQLIWENHRDALRAAEILGVRNSLTERLQAQLPHLDPVQVGASGQIKEYREEENYGEYGERSHRHVSQLMGLYPGTLIRRDTPEWLEAAKMTLTLRGEKSTGWGMAHRLNLWARTGDGEAAHAQLRALLRYGTLTNLWDTHAPFQIDGNLGGTAGIAEMLLQSHEGFIRLLPALPRAWRDGRFDGLVARGNFVVGCEWARGKIRRVRIEARAGGECRILLPDGANVSGIPGALQAGVFAFAAGRGSIYEIFCAEEERKL